MASPTERTLALVRGAGWLPGIVERWIPGAGVRQDLYGCIDIVALVPEGCGLVLGGLPEEVGLGVWALSSEGAGRTVGVQSCGRDFSGHVAKLFGERREQCHNWLRAGNELVLVGWRKLGGRLAPRVRWFHLGEFCGPAPEGSPLRGVRQLALGKNEVSQRQLALGKNEVLQAVETAREKAAKSAGFEDPDCLDVFG